MRTTSDPQGKVKITVHDSGLLNRYEVEQGLMRKELPLESLFVREAFV